MSSFQFDQEHLDAQRPQHSTRPVAPYLLSTYSTLGGAIDLPTPTLPEPAPSPSIPSESTSTFESYFEAYNLQTPNFTPVEPWHNSAYSSLAGAILEPSPIISIDLAPSSPGKASALPLITALDKEPGSMIPQGKDVVIEIKPSSAKQQMVLRIWWTPTSSRLVRVILNEDRTTRAHLATCIAEIVKFSFFPQNDVSTVLGCNINEVYLTSLRQIGNSEIWDTYLILKPGGG